jgi:DNA topoisomerase-1
MRKSLIIVESPSKAKTILKYLGKNFVVMASMGHVKDLPVKRLGVDLERDFHPEYVTIRGKGKFLAEIKAAAGKAERIYLAPDPDREGEAIAWHIAEELNGQEDKVYRVLFNEITERAIKKALESPGKVDLNKVNAQQARRVLDRIVGYKISPILWGKVRRGLSAGRVQSVAVRLVCEREREIQAFVSEEYWSLTAQLEGRNPPRFEARLRQVNGVAAVRIPNGEAAQGYVERLRGETFVVKQVEKKEQRRYPVPPFITSRLQQEAARMLRFTPKKTMMIAQQLYEGVEIGAEGPAGLITYMRTDSNRISEEALTAVRGYIRERFGPDYLPEKPVIYKSKKGAQDAHEAIRPTSLSREPETLKAFLSKDQYQLYKLIWSRFAASQMAPAILEMTRVDIAAGVALFRATGSVTRFPGFTSAYLESREEGDTGTPRANGEEVEENDDEERLLPSLTVGERLRLMDLLPKQHFTQPPPRFTEALLIRDLEEKGIGRPSTYATIISTIQERKYVEKVEGRLKPTELGHVVNDLLVQHFPEVLNVQFTAKMEEELDEIEEGEKDWVGAVRDFYDPFDKSLQRAEVEMRDVKREEIPTDVVCEKCGRKMVIKWGKNGRFLACPGYPDCKNTKEFVEESSGEIRVVVKQETGEICERCGSPLVIKIGRFGRFLACSTYPKCEYTKSITLGIGCPQEGCGGELVEKRTKRGKTFYGCSRYPTCDYATWYKPVPKPCPQCGATFLVEKQSRGEGVRLACAKKECGYHE